MMDPGGEETISKPFSIWLGERDRDGGSGDEAGLEFELESWILRVLLEFVEKVFREMVAGIRVVLLEKVRWEDELGEGFESSEGGDGLRELERRGERERKGTRQLLGRSRVAEGNQNSHPE